MTLSGFLCSIITDTFQRRDTSIQVCLFVKVFFPLLLTCLPGVNIMVLSRDDSEDILLIQNISSVPLSCFFTSRHRHSTSTFDMELIDSMSNIEVECRISKSNVECRCRKVDVECRCRLPCRLISMSLYA